MCGQAGIYRRTDKPVPKLDRLADELLRAIEHRGRDATGYLALMDSGKVQLEKKTITASRFLRERGKIRPDARTVLLHTRFKTVGDKKDPRNAHPVASGKVAAVHNGTIYNANEIFRTFQLPRIGTVDSEVIPAMINYAGWEHVDDVLEMFEGGAATAIIHTDHPDEVVLAKLRTYPMVYAITRDAILWGSEAEALRRAWQRTYGKPLRAKIHTMRDGDVARIKNGQVSTTVIDLAPIYYRRPVSVPACPTKPKAKKRGKRKAPGVPPTRSGQVRTTPDYPAQQQQIPYYTGAYSGYTAQDAIIDLMAQGLTAGQARDIVRDAQRKGEGLREIYETAGWQ